MKTVLAGLAVLSGMITSVGNPAIALEFNYLCYARAASGRVIDLTAICSGQTVSIPAGLNELTASPNSEGIPRVNVNVNHFSENDEFRFVQEGRGGYTDATNRYYDFNYRIWTNRMNTVYRLRIWEAQQYRKGKPLRIEGWEYKDFRSGREALDYFDCNFTSSRVPACPNNSRAAAAR